MRKIRNKENYIDVLSVVACFSMVILHVNNCFWTFSREKYWFSANIIECVFYFAAPVFFMLTGATLIDYRERYDTKTFFMKRIRKVLIPYLFWTFISVVYRFATRSSLVRNVSLIELLRRIVNNEIWYTFWFFIPLFCMYLCIPLLSLIEKEKRKTTYGYMIIFIFIVRSFIPFIINAFHLNLELPFSNELPFDYLLYVLIGYYLSHYEIKEPYAGIIYLLGIFGLLMHTAGTYILSMQSGTIDYTFKGYMNVPCILYTCAVFLFVKNKGSDLNEKIISAVGFFKPYTFGIYLLNMFCIKSFLVLSKIDETLLIYRVLGPFFVIAASIIIIIIARRIGFAFLLPQ